MILPVENTENHILKAAREVFIAKSYEGARMQEIADHAGINKSLLHYYFRNKEKLFDAVFSEVASNLFPAMKQVIEAELGIREKLTFFIKVYLKGLSENPFIPAFIINTLNTDSNRFLRFVKKAGLNPGILQEQIDIEAADGHIRSVKAEHLMVNIIAMCIFPFIAGPIIQSVFIMSDEEYKSYLEARESEIVDFVLKSLAV